MTQEFVSIDEMIYTSNSTSEITTKSQESVLNLYNCPKTINSLMVMHLKKEDEKIGCLDSKSTAVSRLKRPVEHTIPFQPINGEKEVIQLDFWRADRYLEIYCRLETTLTELSETVFPSNFKLVWIA